MMSSCWVTIPGVCFLCVVSRAVLFSQEGGVGVLGGGTKKGKAERAPPTVSSGCM